MKIYRLLYGTNINVHWFIESGVVDYEGRKLQDFFTYEEAAVTKFFSNPILKKMKSMKIGTRYKVKSYCSAQDIYVTCVSNEADESKALTLLKDKNKLKEKIEQHNLEIYKLAGFYIDEIKKIENQLKKIDEKIKIENKKLLKNINS